MLHCLSVLGPAQAEYPTCTPEDGWSPCAALEVVTREAKAQLQGGGGVCFLHCGSSREASPHCPLVLPEHHHEGLHLSLVVSSTLCSTWGWPVAAQPAALVAAEWGPGALHTSLASSHLPATR